MDALFSSLSWIVKHKTVNIDNAVFTLHYRATFGIILLFSLIIGAFQYIGDPIDCLPDSKDLDSGIMDTWCWIDSTYNIRYCPELQVIYKGEENKEFKYYKFYQWIGILLFMQAILFYVPHHIWKTWEGDHIKMLKGKLDDPMLDEESRTVQKNMVVAYLVRNLGNYNIYFAVFSLCELLNLVNVTSQIFYMSFVLDFSFYSLGVDLVNYLYGQSSQPASFFMDTNEARFSPHEFLRRYSDCNASLPVNPLESAFPTMSACTFTQSGPGGNQVPHDLLCVLPLNAVNQKIYTFLWFWFVLISCITAISTVHRGLTILSSQVRELSMKSKMGLLSEEDSSILLKKLAIGDWFLLYQLSKNVDSIVFREIIRDISVDPSVGSENNDMINYTNNFRDQVPLDIHKDKFPD